MKKISFILSALLISTLSFAQTAEDVIKNHIKAVGGNEAIGKIKDLTMTMGGEVQGQNLDIIMQKKTPNKFIQIVSVAGMGEVSKTVSNGVKAQTSGMQGSQDITDAGKLKLLAIQGAVVPEAHYLSPDIKLAYIGKEKVGEVESHKIEVTVGGTKMTEYYDATTGFKIRQSLTAETPMGEQTVITDYTDYKEVNGVRFPHAMVQDMGMMKIELKATKIEVNTNLADALFE